MFLKIWTCALPFCRCCVWKVSLSSSRVIPPWRSLYLAKLIAELYNQHLLILFNWSNMKIVIITLLLSDDNETFQNILICLWRVQLFIVKVAMVVSTLRPSRISTLSWYLWRERISMTVDFSGTHVQNFAKLEIYLHIFLWVPCWFWAIQICIGFPKLNFIFGRKNIVKDAVTVVAKYCDGCFVAIYTTKKVKS